MRDGCDATLRTLLIGIDGACESVLEEVAARGAIPTLQSLRTTGVETALESQIPPWTPSAWPSIYTGVNPGKHGVFGFLTFDGYDCEVIDRTDINEYTLWETLDRHGISSVVVNAPVTHPPREIDGAIIPGYVAPDSPQCVPADALSRIPNGDRYRIYPPNSADETGEEYTSTAVDLVESRGAAFRHLTESCDPSFGFVQFQQTDTVFHERPGDWAAIERIYRAVDEEIASILDTCDPANVIIVSDHGLGKYHGVEFRVNDFLNDHGYVETTRDGDGMPSWSAMARDQLQDNGDTKPSRSWLATAMSTAASVGVTSQRIERVLELVGLAEPVATLAPTDVVRAGAEQVDFQASQAFMRSRIELGVRLNVAGREPAGTIEPGDYDTVRENLIEAFEAVTTPAGVPVFESVYPREAVYQGPYVENAPDIVFVPTDYDHLLSGSIRGERFAPPKEPWNHKRNGILIATGADVDTQVRMDSAHPHIFDVAPTVLATFDVPPAERMDGTALPIVEPLKPEAYPEFESRGSADTDTDRVEQHLAALGYVENE